MMQETYKFLLAAAFSAALFTACGEDSGNNSNNSEQAGCTVSENKDGSYVLSCPDGSEVILHDGVDGKDGLDGTNGADGKDGINGADGKDGTNGTDGKDGTNGADGKDGSSGTDGKDNESGSCTIVVTGIGSHKLVCPDGTSVDFGDEKPASSSSEQKISSSSSAPLVGLTQGYVQFNEDVYTTLKNTVIYLYDADNRQSYANVTLYSTYKGDSLVVTLKNAGQYFYGTFTMSPYGGKDVLTIKLADDLVVKYNDESTGKEQYDLASVKLNKSMMVSFGDSVYTDKTNKAVIKLVDESLLEGTNVSVKVWSSVDTDDRLIQMYPLKDGDITERIGFVEFVNDEPGAGQVKVLANAKVYVRYEGVTASATWKGSAFNGLVCTIDSRLHEYGDSYIEYAVCDGGTFRYALFLEKHLNLGCTSYNDSAVAWNSHKDSVFICVDHRWYYNPAYGLNCAKNGNTQVGLNSEQLVCDDGSFRLTSDKENKLKKNCTSYNRNADVLNDAKDSAFVCSNEGWNYDAYYGMTCAKDGSIQKSLNSEIHVCDGGSFRKPTEKETYLSLGCTSYNKGGTVLNASQDSAFVCSNGSWNYDAAYGLTCAKDGNFQTGMNSELLVCDNGAYRAPNEKEKALNLGCTSYNKNGTVLNASQDSAFVCSNGSWKYDYYYGMTCAEDGSIQVGPKSESVVCDNGSYRVTSTKEVQLGVGCTSYNRGSVIDDYECVAFGWAYMSSAVSYGEIVDPRDGKTYKTVEIDNQTWMAENLNYASDGSYCYNNEADSCSKYGRLYTWAAARSVCPSGWHLPSSDEWSTLFTAVGGTSSAGKVLKSTTGWSGNGNGTDSYGFGVLPAGYRLYNGSFSTAGNYADFWSSTEYDSDYAYFWSFYFYSVDVFRNNYGKGSGYSVRCLRDSD